MPNEVVGQTVHCWKISSVSAIVTLDSECNRTLSFLRIFTSELQRSIRQSCGLAVIRNHLRLEFLQRVNRGFENLEQRHCKELPAGT